MRGNSIEIKTPEERFDRDFLPPEADFVVEAVAAPTDGFGSLPLPPVVAGFVVLIVPAGLLDVLMLTPTVFSPFHGSGRASTDRTTTRGRRHLYPHEVMYTRPRHLTPPQ